MDYIALNAGGSAAKTAFFEQITTFTPVNVKGHIHTRGTHLEDGPLLIVVFDILDAHYGRGQVADSILKLDSVSKDGSADAETASTRSFVVSKEDQFVADLRVLDEIPHTPRKSLIVQLARLVLACGANSPKSHIKFVRCHTLIPLSLDSMQL
ncbi:hypothetical protein IJV57_02705 [Candidatus Saccharibacteria bacterium]|nr:hypothetical protein [Candidatus Saccharibacteria bacterium]